MDTRELNRIVNGFEPNPLSTITAMMLNANRKYKEKYTKAEREKMRQEHEAIRNEEIRCSQVRQGICPSCKGKLTRGKKDKQNNYKRSWGCKECKKVHLV